LFSRLDPDRFRAAFQFVACVAGAGMTAVYGVPLGGALFSLNVWPSRDRDAQFGHIDAAVKEFQATGEPVISADTTKKELVGDFKNAGR
jgi:hypothetical protein